MSADNFNKRVLPVKDKLFRFALKILVNEQEARDAVREVLHKVWKQKHRLDGYLSAETWCMSMLRIECLQRRKPLSPEMQINYSGPGTATGNGNIEQPEEPASRVKKVHQLIGALPDIQNCVIHLRDVEGFSYLDIAEILQIEVSTVKIHLFKARNSIKTKLLITENYGTL